MKLYRKKRPSFLKRLFRFVVTILVISIFVDIYSPETSKKVSTFVIENYQTWKQEKAEKKLAEKIKDEEEAAKKAAIQEIKIASKENNENIKDKFFKKDYLENYENIPYAAVDSHELTLDISRPDNNDVVPIIIYITGENWIFTNKTGNNPVLFNKLKELKNKNIALVTLEYRDLSKTVFPGQINDIQSAIKFLKTNAKIYGINPDKIAIIGEETAGTLAQLIGNSTTDPLTKVNSVVSIGAISDIRTLVLDINEEYFNKQDAIKKFDTPESNYAKIIGFNKEKWMGISAIRKMERKEAELLTNPYWKYVTLARNISPINSVTKDSVPTYIIHNLNDRNIPVNQGLKLSNKLTELGVENIYVSQISEAGNYQDEERLNSALDWVVKKLSETKN